MYMSDNEIVMRYREAKDREEQLDILADLNAVNKKDIVDILIRNGFDIKLKPERKKRPYMTKKQKLKVLFEKLDNLEPELTAAAMRLKEKEQEYLEIVESIKGLG